MVDPTSFDITILTVIGGAVFIVLVAIVLFFKRREDSSFDENFNKEALIYLSEPSKKDKKNLKKATKKTEKNKEKKDSEAKKESPRTESKRKVEENTVVKPADEKQEEETEKVVDNVPVEAKLQIDTKLGNGKENIKTEKKKSPKPIVNLDFKKVIQRLSSCENIEQEYVKFLETMQREHELQKHSLKEEVKAGQRKLMENNTRIDKLTKDKLALENFKKEEITKNATLSARVKQMSTLEAELRRQLGESQTTIARIEEVRGRDVGELQQTISALRRELDGVKNDNKKLAEEVKTNSVPKVSEIEFNNLNVQIRALEKVVADCKQELEKKINTVKELTVEITAKNETIQKLESEKQEWVKKESSLVVEYANLKKMVESTTKQLEEFVDSKTAVEKQNVELKQREADLLKKQGELFEKQQQDEEKIADLEKALFDKAQEVEEVVIVQRENAVSSAPSSSSSEEFEKVKAENQRLQAKIEELRNRNFAILEKVESAGHKAPEAKQNVSKERKIVVTTIGDLAKKPLENLEDSGAYTKWLQDTTADIRKRLSSQSEQSVGKTAAPKKDKKRKPSESSTVPTSGDVTVYRDALNALMTELDHIEKLAAKQASEYEAKIVELKQNLN
ncbi:unnamed protein product [Caenorhabditis bovis]|uniref:Uncharacterized protein n=1 Tax=Caenorhabditis bovis TaxID=2654633 RepID=A0A8S1EEA0_9PELO|nr:unnamed protein product [Caenorhabditis bovis]